MAKILYAAGTFAHIKSFHLPYISALKKAGHEVLVMASGKGADFDIAFEKKMLSLRNIKCQREIKRILKQEKFDAIILNTTLAAFNIRMALPRKNRPRVLNLVHGYMFCEEPEGIKERIFLFAEKFLRSRTDSIIVMNDEDLRSAYRYSLTKGEIVKVRGMGAKVPTGSESPEGIRKKLSSESDYAIIFIGELSNMKNQALLISSLPKIKEKIPNSVIWLLGAGGSEEELRTLSKELGVKDSVKFVGYVQNPADYVRAADIYIAPSRKEGLPFNIIEALGCQIPIIASDIKGHRDLIEDELTGLLFKKDSSEELIEKLMLLYNKELTFDKTKQKEIYECFSFDQVFDETLEVIKDLAQL